MKCSCFVCQCMSLWNLTKVLDRMHSSSSIVWEGPELLQENLYIEVFMDVDECGDVAFAYYKYFCDF